jgi:hypothetical protein
MRGNTRWIEKYANSAAVVSRNDSSAARWQRGDSLRIIPAKGIKRERNAKQFGHSERDDESNRKNDLGCPKGRGGMAQCMQRILQYPRRRNAAGPERPI